MAATFLFPWRKPPADAKQFCIWHRALARAAAVARMFCVSSLESVSTCFWAGGSFTWQKWGQRPERFSQFYQVHGHQRSLVGSCCLILFQLLQNSAINVCPNCPNICFGIESVPGSSEWLFFALPLLALDTCTTRLSTGTTWLCAAMLLRMSQDNPNKWTPTVLSVFCSLLYSQKLWRLQFLGEQDGEKYHKLQYPS